MGRAVNLSPLGLYNWDNTVFNMLQVPEGLNKEVLIKNLLAETAELEVLYPNPVVFRNLVGLWSTKQLDIWNRLYATTQYEYNPIENYNRIETGSEDGTGSTTHSGKDTLDMTRKDGGTEKVAVTGHTEQGGSDTIQGADTKGHWIAGFDSQPASAQDDGLVKQTRDQDDATTTTTYGKEEDNTGSSTTTFGKTETNKDETTYGKRIQTSNEGSHELHAHGNIGVTTTQKLIREQRDIELFNLYDIIIEEFKMRFCILVY